MATDINIFLSRFCVNMPPRKFLGRHIYFLKHPKKMFKHYLLKKDNFLSSIFTALKSIYICVPISTQSFIKLIQIPEYRLQEKFPAYKPQKI